MFQSLLSLERNYPICETEAGDGDSEWSLAEPTKYRNVYKSSSYRVFSSNQYMYLTFYILRLWPRLLISFLKALTLV